MNSLERVEYVRRVGVVSEVEFHICCSPSVRTTRLNKLGGRKKGGRRRYITPSQRQTLKLERASEKLVK